MRFITHTLTIAAVLVTGLAATTAFAKENKWQRHHPRRAEVNHRLHNQNARIDDKVKDGQMTKQQARQLHKDDHQIRQEERDMAAQDHGHLTKADQRAINQQENAVSKDISHE